VFLSVQDSEPNGKKFFSEAFYKELGLLLASGALVEASTHMMALEVKLLGQLMISLRVPRCQ
jgi:hypothetical protein